MMVAMRVVIWIIEGTWQQCVDAAATLIPADAEVTFLHVTPTDAAGAAEEASATLLGRGGWRHRPEPHPMQAVAEAEGAELLDAAAERLGRTGVAKVTLRGHRVEHDVVQTLGENVDLLVLARDGDRAHVGPRSLGHATRFVVDHAPCAVLLVW
jgi:nucleotide-binding universal stress UspA family protein